MNWSKPAIEKKCKDVRYSFSGFPYLPVLLKEIRGSNRVTKIGRFGAGFPDFGLILLNSQKKSPEPCIRMLRTFKSRLGYQINMYSFWYSDILKNILRNYVSRKISDEITKFRKYSIDIHKTLNFNNISSILQTAFQKNMSWNHKLHKVYYLQKYLSQA